MILLMVAKHLQGLEDVGPELLEVAWPLEGAAPEGALHLERRAQHGVWMVERAVPDQSLTRSS